ncbi:MAG: hypothetical protein LLG00_05735 [Planctomycetaceae bacterium]|nr:hypothetical protein [Planctomycetaceae bacterium]
MTRPIIAALLLALIAGRGVAGEEDLATQVKTLKKERLETLTELVKIYTLQYEVGYVVTGETFAEADAALVNAQLDAAHKPDAIAAILAEAAGRQFAGMTTAATRNQANDVFWWSLASSPTSFRVNGEGKNEYEIKALREKQVAELAESVEKFTKRYKAGTAPLDALVKARAALLDAQLETAVSQRARAAILRIHARNDAFLLRMAEQKQKAAALASRALFLNAKVRVLRDAEAKDQVAELKAARKERVETLTELVKLDAGLWSVGWTTLATLTQAKADLANARADAADTREAKIQVLTEAVKQQAEQVRVAEVRVQAGFDTKADIDRERLHLLDLKIRLLKERAPQK